MNPFGNVNAGNVVVWALGLTAGGCLLRIGWELGGKLWGAF